MVGWKWIPRKGLLMSAKWYVFTILVSISGIHFLVSPKKCVFFLMRVLYLITNLLYAADPTVYVLSVLCLFYCSAYAPEISLQKVNIIIK
jgi:hypothetical protein